MTERWILFLKYLAQGDTITRSVITFTVGFIGLDWVMSISPFKFLRKLAGLPFWSLAIVTFLAILAGLLFMQCHI